MKIFRILMGSVAFANSSVYFMSHSLADFLLKRRPKSDQKGKKSLLKDHGLLKKTMLGTLQKFKCSEMLGPLAFRWLI